MTGRRADRRMNASRRRGSWAPWAVALAVAVFLAGWAVPAAAAPVLTLQEALQRALVHHPSVIDGEQNVIQAGLALEREEARRRLQASASADVAGIRRNLLTGEYELVSAFQQGEAITVNGSLQLGPGTSLTVRLSEEAASPGSGTSGGVAQVSLTRQLLPNPRHSEAAWSLTRAGEAVRESEARLARARASALVDVYRRYRSLQVEEAKLELQAAAAALAEERYRETLRQWELGLVSEADIANAELERDRAQANLVRARREFELTKAAFARDLGLGAAGGMRLEPLPAETSWSPVTVDPEAAAQRALAASVDVLAARRNLEAAERRYEAALADTGLRASLSVGVQVPRWSGGSTPEYRASLGATYDFLDGGARQVERREAELALERARRALENAEIAIRTDVARRLNELDWLAAQVDFARRGLESARRTYEARVEQAARGVISERTVEESRRSVQEAYLAYVEAVVNYEAAWLELQAVMGEGIVIEGVAAESASSGQNVKDPSP
ncbi:MAG: hypothetical protein CW345_10085 [Firmicutes bacterium]|nr:hypothetical protein [Bacillota bacterium]